MGVQGDLAACREFNAEQSQFRFALGVDEIGAGDDG